MQPKVEFRVTCPCGTNLTVHGQHIPVPDLSSRDRRVICPKCDTQHEMPAPVYRFFYQGASEDQWNLAPQRNVI